MLPKLIQQGTFNRSLYIALEFRLALVQEKADKKVTAERWLKTIDVHYFSFLLPFLSAAFYFQELR
jgi:hypothetical protein